MCYREKLSKVLEEVVHRVSYIHKFKGQADRIGLGHKLYNDMLVERKELTQEVRIMSDEEMILSLADQSKWNNWDELIELHLKLKEIMYGMCPSRLSFIVNSLQNTLHQSSPC